MQQKQQQQTTDNNNNNNNKVYACYIASGPTHKLIEFKTMFSNWMDATKWFDRTNDKLHKEGRLSEDYHPWYEEFSVEEGY